MPSLSAQAPRLSPDEAPAPAVRGGPLLEGVAGHFILLWGWKRYLVALLAGAIAAFAQAPYDFFAVCLVSFPVLVWLLDGATADPGKRFLGRLMPAFWTGFWFGFGYFLCGLWWIADAMFVDLSQYGWALPAPLILLPALMALFYGFATALARLAWSEGIGRIAALAAAFAVAEWLRSFVLSGFPWNAIGYAIMPTPLLMQTDWLIGMTGMNALAVFLFAAPALLGSDRHVKVGLALAVVLAAANVGFGYFRLAGADLSAAPTLDVRLVQPSVDQGEKWSRDRRDAIFQTYLEMSGRPFHPPGDKQETADARPQLIVWPETSVPFLFNQRPDGLAALGKLLGKDQVLLAGAVRMEGDDPNDPATRFYNSVVAVNDAGVIYDAGDKTHLVPLGEYVPFASLLSRIGITKLVTLPGEFSAGTDRHPIQVAPGVTALPFICYEIIFPGLVLPHAGDADLIVNVTNDAWYGDTPGPFQHFRQAQVRAVEAGRPLAARRQQRHLGGGRSLWPRRRCADARRGRRARRARAAGPRPGALLRRRQPHRLDAGFGACSRRDNARVCATAKAELTGVY